MVPVCRFEGLAGQVRIKLLRGKRLKLLAILPHVFNALLPHIAVVFLVTKQVVCWRTCHRDRGQELVLVYAAAQH